METSYETPQIQYEYFGFNNIPNRRYEDVLKIFRSVNQLSIAERFQSCTSRAEDKK